MAKKIEVYAFSDVVKILEITSNVLNDLISTGKLKPVRHKGRLKFRKDNVDQVKKALDKKRQQKKTQEQEAKQQKSSNLWGSTKEDRFISWEEVLNELQIDDSDLRGLVEEGELQAYEGQTGLKFKAEEIEKFKQQQQNKQTMMVAPSWEQNMYSMPTEALAPAAPPVEEHYKFDKVLTILQMESAELERMITDGEITAINSSEGIKLLKVEIDMLKQERMIDATVVVPPENMIEEDEEIVPILISAHSEGALSVAQDEEEFCTLEEAAAKMQVEHSDIKRMIARQEIEATRGDDGRWRIPTKDLRPSTQTIEPTVILPDESEGEIDEETKNLPKLDIKLSSSPEKTFYGIHEAADLLKVSKEQINVWIAENKLRSFHHEGAKKIRRSDLIVLEKKLNKSTRKTYANPSIASAQSNFYTMEEVKCLLGVEEKDVKIMVAKGQLEVQRSGKDYQFPKSSVEKKLIEKLSAGEPEKKEEKNKGPKSVPNSQGNFENTMLLPLIGLDDESPVPLPLIEQPKVVAPPPKPAVPPKPAGKLPAGKKAKKKITKEDLRNNYYKQDEVLQILQLEEHEITELVRQGALKRKKYKEVRYYEKAEVDELKKGKMIEPTIMVEGDAIDDILEDDDDDIFFMN